MISAGLVKELREKTGAGMLDCKKALEANDGNIEESVDWLREKGILKVASKSERIAAEGIATIFVDNTKAVLVELNCETDFVAINKEFQELAVIIAKTVINCDFEDIEQALILKYNEESLNDLIVAKTAKIGEKISFRRFQLIEKENNQQFGSYIHMGGKIAVLTLVENGSEEKAKDIAMHIAAMKPLYVRREDVDDSLIEKEQAILKEQAISEGKPLEIAEKMVEGRIQKYFKEICLEEQEFVKNSDQTVKEYLKEAKVIQFIRYEVGEGIEKRSDNFVDEVMCQIKKD